jgi:hypothetical protein
MISKSLKFKQKLKPVALRFPENIAPEINFPGDENTFWQDQIPGPLWVIGERFSIADPEEKSRILLSMGRIPLKVPIDRALAGVILNGNAFCNGSAKKRGSESVE